MYECVQVKVKFKWSAVLALEKGTSGGIGGSLFLPFLLFAAVAIVISGAPSWILLLMKLTFVPGRLVIPLLLLSA